MTGITVGRCVCKSVAVTLGTGNIDMGAGQRKYRGTVIEGGWIPGDGRVTKGAVVVKTSCGVIRILGGGKIGLVATIAVGSDFAVIKS